MPAQNRLFTTAVAKVYPYYIAKAEKKGRTKAEVDAVICWLTGYTPKRLEAELKKRTDFETFFAQAPKPNPLRSSITGMICGVRIEAIKESTMREIRYLDKLVDELAQGRPMEKVLRKDGPAKKTAGTARGTSQVALPPSAPAQVSAERRSAEAELRQLVRKFAPVHARLFDSARRYLQRRMPGTHELAYEYRDAFVISFSPDDRGYEGVLAIRASADGVKLYFNHGAKLADPGKLLRGSGQTRTFILGVPTDLRRPALVRLIDEAVSRHSRPKPPKGPGPLVIRSTSAQRRRAGS